MLPSDAGHHAGFGAGLFEAELGVGFLKTILAATCPYASTPPGPNFGPVIQVGIGAMSSRILVDLAHWANASRADESG